MHACPQNANSTYNTTVFLTQHRLYSQLPSLQTLQDSFSVEHPLRPWEEEKQAVEEEKQDEKQEQEEDFFCKNYIAEFFSSKMDYSNFTRAKLDYVQEII